jgi:hypothetical protein
VSYGLTGRLPNDPATTGTASSTMTSCVEGGTVRSGRRWENGPVGTKTGTGELPLLIPEPTKKKGGFGR